MTLTGAQLKLTAREIRAVAVLAVELAKHKRQDLLTTIRSTGADKCLTENGAWGLAEKLGHHFREATKEDA